MSKSNVDLTILAQVLHREVMNIRCNAPFEFRNPSPEDKAYKIGHRDARHSAADIVLQKLKEIVESEENSEPHELLLSLCDLISNGHSTSDILKSRTWNDRLRDYFERTESEE